MNKKYKLLKDKTVLYVEDDSILQKNIMNTLGHFFDKLLIASNGDDAYDIYIKNQNKIDLIITDINMPKTDGITLSKLIREYDKNLPIIIISAYTDTDYLLDSIDLNIVKYITKPFTTKKIINLLDKLLEYFKLNNYIIINNNIRLNYENGELIIDNKNIKLTNREKIFLKLLSENNIITYDMMYDYMWDIDKSPSSDAIKSFIKKIKRKLPHNLIKNQHSVGYYLDKSPYR
ncbi:MAG: response regulator transcription factor [Sulfurovaceae bacterium]|nr:response regulator transcription factor [Sulfurovaceae bacterium]